MENDVSKNNFKTKFGTIVSHTKIHLCAKYGHFITNYAKGMAIPWSFGLKPIHVYTWYTFLWRIFLECLLKYGLSFFLSTSTHKSTSCQQFRFFEVFFIFFEFFQKLSKWPAWLFIERGRFFQNYRRFYDVITTRFLEKNSEQTITHL